jgi:hypothetical protein
VVLFFNAVGSNGKLPKGSFTHVFSFKKGVGGTITVWSVGETFWFEA